jgi:hypothetical protein
MTSLTPVEIKIVVFALFFVAILGAFVSAYNLQPVPQQTYSGQTGATNQTSSTSDIWISGLIGVLPAPFDDPIIAFISSIFIVPIVTMLAYISIRAIKDLVSQWV